MVLRRFPGLAWHRERSFSVQALSEETTTVEPSEEGEVLTIIADQEPITTGQDAQLPPTPPEPTPEELRAEMVEVINAVTIGRRLIALRAKRKLGEECHERHP